MELLCLFLCLWTLEILKKYQLIKAWQGRFLNKLAKVWYDIMWGMESSVVGQNWIPVKNCNWWFSIFFVVVSYPEFMNNWGFGTKDIENKSGFKDFILTKQFCPVTDRYLHFCAFTTNSATCTLFKAQDAVHSMFIMWSIFTATRHLKTQKLCSSPMHHFW